ncbi:MAG: pilus assembly protein [Chloroflexi bacterium]|nr:pilus assembly protein [Chloroflexota bacterium]
MIEVAIAFPLLLIVAIALVQFAVFCHAQNVVAGAVQDGARVAAAEDRTLTDGVDHARALLRAALGPKAEEVRVQGTDGGDAVAIEARGELRAIIPWVADARLPLWARSVMSKERFRAGPNG